MILCSFSLFLIWIKIHSISDGFIHFFKLLWLSISLPHVKVIKFTYYFVYFYFQINRTFIQFLRWNNFINKKIYFIFQNIFPVSSFLLFIPISLPKTKILLENVVFLLAVSFTSVSFTLFRNKIRIKPNKQAIWKDYLLLIYLPQQPETVAFELLFWLQSCKKTVNSLFFYFFDYSTTLVDYSNGL